MKHSMIISLLLAMLAATPIEMSAQNKAWVTYSNNTLTFSYGAKPKAPAQVKCSGCSRMISFTTNYCSNCGTKNEKDFAVFDFYGKKPWYEGSDVFKPVWYVDAGDKRKKIKKAVFAPSFRQVTNITSTAHWFADMGNLESIEGLENLNTSKVTEMFAMFISAESLRSIDVSKLNTSNVTDMSCMFKECMSLTQLDLSNFKTSKVVRMDQMFYKCEKLTSLNVSSFDTRNVKDMEWMFKFCKSLTSLNVSSFDTRNVKDMESMFEGCESLTTLNLTNFDTQGAMCTWMFNGCTKLKEIYVSAEKWEPKIRKDTYRPSLMDGCSAKIIKK